jgi:SAM-dependent methyltransferase
LAKYYDDVWSLEAVKERIEFQKIRQEQDGINNINFVRADLLHLPFPNNYFDLVVANGVLEWAGLSDCSRNPREVQLDFLKEIKRIMKPKGCLYIGIENRFGFPFILGGKDHSGLPFTSLLPRKLSDVIVKISGKAGEYRQGDQIKKWENYRTYTYSYWGYRKILKDAGFIQAKLYWTLAYNAPKHAGKFYDESFNYFLNLTRENSNNASNIGSLLTSLGVNLPGWVIKLGLPFICPSFLIFAYKENQNISFESKLLELDLPNSSFLRMSGSHGISSKINYFLINDGNPSSIIKFPRFKEVTSLAFEEKRMAQFNPLNIRKDVIDNVAVFIEPVIKGAQPKLYNLSHNQKVLYWLLDFQRKTQNGYWDFEQLEAKIIALCNFLSEIHLDNEIRSRTGQRMELFMKSLQCVKIQRTSEHGDFFAGNMLIGEDDQVYVTDWEFYQEDGEPLFDFVFFILDTSTKGTMPKSFQDNFLGKGKYSPILETLISEYTRTKQLPPELILQAIPYVILRCLYRAATGVDNKHLDINRYIYLLELWDEICDSATSHILAMPQIRR